jgi:hypothetical protein
MPRVSAFYGVVIYRYWNERDHPIAHLHAYHAGRRASVSADGEVLAGTVEPRALRAGDAAAGTFADWHYTRRYAIRPFTAIG